HGRIRNRVAQHILLSVSVAGFPILNLQRIVIALGVVIALGERGARKRRDGFRGGEGILALGRGGQEEGRGHCQYWQLSTVRHGRGTFRLQTLEGRVSRKLGGWPPCSPGVLPS